MGRPFNIRGARSRTSHVARRTSSRAGLANAARATCETRLLVIGFGLVQYPLGIANRSTLRGVDRPFFVRPKKRGEPTGDPPPPTGQERRPLSTSGGRTHSSVVVPDVASEPSGLSTRSPRNMAPMYYQCLCLLLVPTRYFIGNRGRHWSAQARGARPLAVPRPSNRTTSERARLTAISARPDRTGGRCCRCSAAGCDPCRSTSASGC